MFRIHNDRAIVVILPENAFLINEDVLSFSDGIIGKLEKQNYSEIQSTTLTQKADYRVLVFARNVDTDL